MAHGLPMAMALGFLTLIVGLIVCRQACVCFETARPKPGVVLGAIGASICGLAIWMMTIPN